MVTEIIGIQGTKSTADTTNTNKADAGITSKNIIEKKDEAKSAIMSSIDNIVDKGTGLVGDSFKFMGFVILILAVLAYFFKDVIASFLGIAPSQPASNADSNQGIPDDYGNDYGNDYDETVNKYFSLGQEGGKCNFEIELYDPILKVILIILILNVVISNKN
jgi:hypothetical protein